MGHREALIHERLLDHPLAVVEGAVDLIRLDVATPAGQLLLLPCADTAFGVEHLHRDALLAGEGCSHRPTGVAAGGNQDGQLLASLSEDPLHSGGEKARPEVLEGRRGPPEELQDHLLRREWIKRDGEVEGFGADLSEVWVERIALEEGGEHLEGKLGVTGDLPIREMGQGGEGLGDVEASIRSQALHDGVAGSHRFCVLSCRDVLHRVLLQTGAQV